MSPRSPAPTANQLFDQPTASKEDAAGVTKLPEKPESDVQSTKRHKLTHAPSAKDLVSVFAAGWSDFKLEELLGEGGLAQVWRARHKTDPNAPPVAIKIASHSSFWSSHEVEIAFLGRMAAQGKNLPWVPQYWGKFGTIPFSAAGHLHGGKPWYAMELLGPSLHKYIFEIVVGAVDVESLRYIMSSALSAVEALHNEGYVHRDIKLENFAWRVATQPGTKPELVLIDYGFVTPFDPESEDVTVFNGTDIYGSDNALRQGPLGPFDDLESLGYAFFELITHSLVPWDVRDDDTAANTQPFDPIAVLPQYSLPPSIDLGAPPRTSTYHSASEEPPQKGTTNNNSTRSSNEDDSSDEDSLLVDFCTQRLHALCKDRAATWEALVKEGMVPKWLQTWMSYCKGHSRCQWPDYDMLHDLLVTAPLEEGGLLAQGQKPEE